jgi:hypothetical protein
MTESYDIEYFRAKNCGTCGNKKCPRDYKNVDACISDEMTREFDRMEELGELEELQEQMILREQMAGERK